MPQFPWKIILKNAPVIVAAAESLLNQSRQRAAATEATADTVALRRRVMELDEQQRASAELVRQLADQVNAMAQAAEQSASKLRVAYGLAIAGTVLGIAGCLIAVLR
jgi:hypothetical protein